MCHGDVFKINQNKPARAKLQCTGHPTGITHMAGHCILQWMDVQGGQKKGGDESDELQNWAAIHFATASLGDASSASTLAPRFPSAPMLALPACPLPWQGHRQWVQAFPVPSHSTTPPPANGMPPRCSAKHSILLQWLCLGFHKAPLQGYPMPL